MLPVEINNWLINTYGKVESFTAAAGGCINHGATIRIFNHQYFIKWNSAVKFPSMFQVEAKGLNLLKQSDFHIPNVINVYSGQEYDALLLENISKGEPTANFWEIFGLHLSEMHRITNSIYGLDHDNYMGSLKQENSALHIWTDFFIARRLMPQVSLAQSNGYFNTTQLNRIERLYQKIPELLSTELPSLVHGDLWSGNFMVNQDGEPVLIDPAVSFSHREVDLAMTKLFGGFDDRFYESYQENFPTETGLNDRLDIYNLYPLLIHLNLFGSGYHSQIMHVINRFE